MRNPRRVRKLPNRRCINKSKVIEKTQLATQTIAQSTTTKKQSENEEESLVLLKQAYNDGEVDELVLLQEEVSSKVNNEILRSHWISFCPNLQQVLKIEVPQDVLTLHDLLSWVE